MAVAKLAVLLVLDVGVGAGVCMATGVGVAARERELPCGDSLARLVGSGDGVVAAKLVVGSCNPLISMLTAKSTRMHARDQRVTNSTSKRFGSFAT